MSVLVEALSLIVPRRVLDIGYPGGTDDFMKRMCGPSVPCRLVCADEQLVSVSFHNVDEAQVVAAELMDYGVVGVDEGRFFELAMVDQIAGPMMPCDWLEWRRHKDGFTYCWAAGADPDPMHVPENWTPEQSRGLTFHDLRDEPDRCFKLADEEQREIWLDFHTGALFAAPLREPSAVHPEPSDTMELPSADSPEPIDPQDGVLASTIREALDAQGYRYRKLDDCGFDLSIRTHVATYRVYVAGHSKTDLVRALVGMGSYIPAERRGAIAEAITRINYRVMVGNFDLDFSDGELRFRVAMDVEDGLLSTTMVDNMISFALFTMDEYHHALMRVAFGNVDPETAIGEVQ